MSLQLQQQQQIVGDKDTYLAILKVYGSAVHLWPYNGTQSLSQDHSFSIYCHDRESPNNNIKVFVLPESPSPQDECLLNYQNPEGQSITSNDLAIFMTAPMPNTRNPSFAIDLNLLQRNQESGKVDARKIGSVFLFLDSGFATQGTQRMQIIGAHNSKPIGQMQVEYLIIKDPLGYGVRVPLPKWLTQTIHLDAGHRGSGSGCRADLPGSITENTVASFNYAARHGADMCELDVMCTSDGIPIIYHNYALDTSKPGSTQIDELTLDELRSLKNLSIHDKGCNHNLDTNDAATHKSCRPFPTLEEVLQDVDPACALNIELKWPQALTSGKNEAIQYREINDHVDRILRCINEHHNGRRIFLSTFNANIALMLRLKQTQFPVLFLTTGNKDRFRDPTTKTVLSAVHFAQAFDLAGINPNVEYLDGKLVRYAQDRGLLVYAWGKIETSEAVREWKRTGINGIIYDKIDLIKPQN